MMKQIALAFGPIAAVLVVLLVIKASSADEKPKRAKVTISLDDDAHPPMPPVPPIAPIAPIAPIPPIPPLPPLAPHAGGWSKRDLEKLRVTLADMNGRIRALHEEAARAGDDDKDAAIRSLKLRAYEHAADAMEQALEDHHTSAEDESEPPDPPAPTAPPAPR